MSDFANPKPLAIVAATVTPRLKTSGYPEPFRSRVAGRQRRILGDIFGLRNFGVNLTTLKPGGGICPASPSQPAG